MSQLTLEAIKLPETVAKEFDALAARTQRLFGSARASLTLAGVGAGAALLGLVLAWLASPSATLSAPHIPEGLLSVLASVPGSTPKANAEFETVASSLMSLLNGPLSKALALGMFLVGAASGVVRQSVSAAVAGIAGAIMMAVMPSVLATLLDTGAGGAEQARNAAEDTFVQLVRRGDTHGVVSALNAVARGAGPQVSYVVAQARLLEGQTTTTALSDDAKSNLRSEADIVVGAADQGVRDFSPPVLYAIETVAFGETRSKLAADYAATWHWRESAARTVEYTSALVALAMAAIAAAISALAAPMRARVRRIEPLLARSTPPPGSIRRADD